MFSRFDFEGVLVYILVTNFEEYMPERKGKWFLEFSFMEAKEYGMGSFPKTTHIQLGVITEEEAIEKGGEEWQKIKAAKLFNHAICPRVVYTIDIHTQP